MFVLRGFALNEKMATVAVILVGFFWIVDQRIVEFAYNGLVNVKTN